MPRLLATSSFSQWVQAVEIVNPGFLNVRLKTVAKAAGCTRSARCRWGIRSAAIHRRKGAGRVRLSQPDGPLHVGHGRQAALGDAICNLRASQGDAVYREFYYNDAGVQIQTLATSVQMRAKGLKPGDADWPSGERLRLTTVTTSPTSPRTSRRRRLLSRTTARSPRAAMSTTLTRSVNSLWPTCGGSKTSICGRSVCASTTTTLRSSLYSKRTRRIDSGQAGGPCGMTYEQDGALWLRSSDYGDDKDRVMKKGDGTYTYFVPDVAYHIAKWGRAFTRSSTSRVPTTTAPSHECALSQPAGRGREYSRNFPDYVLHDGARHEEW